MKYEKYVDIYIGIKFSLQTPKLNLLCLWFTIMKIIEGITEWLTVWND